MLLVSVSKPSSRQKFQFDHFPKLKNLDIQFNSFTMATTRLHISFLGSVRLTNIYIFPISTFFDKCRLILFTSNTSPVSNVGCIELPEH